MSFKIVAINFIKKYLLRNKPLSYYTKLFHFSKKKKMKLGVTYSLFGGEEMLRGSILSIRKHVDYINVVYQQYSWFGDKASDSMISTLQKLLDEGLVDRIIEYNFTDFKNSDLLAYYTIQKKNIGLKDLKKNNCTHCMIMDSDEYFLEDEFVKAKEYIINHKVTHSCCPIYDYRFISVCRNRDVNKYSVPFIFKLRRASRLSKNPGIPCFIDNLRSLKYHRCVDRFYYFNSVKMHHMTGIRNDFQKKLDSTVTNSTDEGKQYVKEFGKEYFRQRNLSLNELLQEKNELGGYIIVEDTFGLMSKEDISTMQKHAVSTDGCFISNIDNDRRLEDIHNECF